MLPINVIQCETPDIVASTSHGYIQMLQRRLDWEYKMVDEVNKGESEHSKKWYDWNVKYTQNQEILSLSDKRPSKGSIKSAIGGKTPLIV